VSLHSGELKNRAANEEEHRLKPVLPFTESATENKPPRKVAAVTGGRETCSSSCKGAFAGKGETVG